MPSGAVSVVIRRLARVVAVAGLQSLRLSVWVVCHTVFV